MIKIGGSGIADVRVGDAAIAEVRIGNDIVYQSATRGGKWTLMFSYYANRNTRNLQWDGQKWKGSFAPLVDFELSCLGEQWRLSVVGSEGSEIVYSYGGKKAKSLVFTNVDGSKTHVTNISAVWSAN